MLKSCGSDAKTGGGGSFSRWSSESRERNRLSKSTSGRCASPGKKGRHNGFKGGPVLAGIQPNGGIRADTMVRHVNRVHWGQAIDVDGLRCGDGPSGTGRRWIAPSMRVLYASERVAWLQVPNPAKWRKIKKLLRRADDEVGRTQVLMHYGKRKPTCLRLLDYKDITLYAELATIDVSSGTPYRLAIWIGLFHRDYNKRA